jgi:transcriptional regulator with XRE-family HTH domain
MADVSKRPRLVGEFIRKRREALGISQRALGLLFVPSVTTQFISNVERGVTPLPPAHVPTLAEALKVTEVDLMNLLEKEYTLKLSEKLKRSDTLGTDLPSLLQPTGLQIAGKSVSVASGDYDFIRSLYDAFQKADAKSRQDFISACSSILNLTGRGPFEG